MRHENDWCGRYLTHFASDILCICPLPGVDFLAHAGELTLGSELLLAALFFC